MARRKKDLTVKGDPVKEVVSEIVRAGGRGFNRFVKSSSKSLRTAGIAISAFGMGFAAPPKRKNGRRAKANRLDQAFDASGKVLMKSGGVISKGAGALSAAPLSSEGIEQVSEFIGTAASGALAGVGKAARGTVASVAIRQTDLDNLISRLDSARRRHHLIVEAHAERISVSTSLSEQRKLWHDILMIGGVSISAALSKPNAVPKEVIEAFNAAYPGLANQMTFLEAVRAQETPEALMGFLSGVKGKLFELIFVRYLNDGNLPQGTSAVLAESVNQSGWDLRIIDEEGHVVDLLQAKATESVSYVQEALKTHPEIDVVTTSEVYASLYMQGVNDHIINSGISEEALQALVDKSAEESFNGLAQWFSTSTVGLAFTALSVFADGRSREVQSREFGERSSQAVIAGGITAGVLVVSQTWLLSIAAGIGSRYLWGHGEIKRRQLEELKRLVSAAEASNRRIAKSLPSVTRRLLAKS